MEIFGKRFGKEEKTDSIFEQKKNQAKAYLELIADGEIKTVNISPHDARNAIRELEHGDMPTYAIDGHAADYLDYINGIERD